MVLVMEMEMEMVMQILWQIFWMNLERRTELQRRIILECYIIAGNALYKRI